MANHKVRTVLCVCLTVPGAERRQLRVLVKCPLEYDNMDIIAGLVCLLWRMKYLPVINIIVNDEVISVEWFNGSFIKLLTARKPVRERVIGKFDRRTKQCHFARNVEEIASNLSIVIDKEEANDKGK